MDPPGPVGRAVAGSPSESAGTLDSADKSHRFPQMYRTRPVPSLAWAGCGRARAAGLATTAARLSQSLTRSRHRQIVICGQIVIGARAGGDVRGGRNELPGPTESDSGGGRGSNPRLQRRPCPQAAGPVAGRRLSLPRTESGPCGVLPVKEAARTKRPPRPWLRNAVTARRSP